MNFPPAQPRHIPSNWSGHMTRTPSPANFLAIGRAWPKHPLVYCRVNREPVSGKGRYQSLDLRNVRTLYPAYGQDRGSFVATYKKEDDISLTWPANLAKAQGKDSFPNRSPRKLLESFPSHSRQSYQSAIKGFIEEGLAHQPIGQTGRRLRRALARHLQGSQRRQQPRKPAPTAFANRNGDCERRQSHGHCCSVATPAPRGDGKQGNSNCFTGAAFADCRRRVLRRSATVLQGTRSRNYRILSTLKSCLGWHDKKPELLSLTDHHLDYSLHESPVISNDGFDDTNESPSETSLLLR